MKAYESVDEYIASFPKNVQKILQKIRNTIKVAAPNATEKISYGIPTYWQGKNIVHFGAYASHIGLYPGSGAIVEFKDKLKNYETSKGTIRLPLDRPIPYGLIELITLYGVAKYSTS
ncbi:MAG: DUF1801 domain-containing protein [bacterium]|nr:DUF1801 domain-containing protein [bacterium]